MRAPHHARDTKRQPNDVTSVVAITLMTSTTPVPDQSSANDRGHSIGLLDPASDSALVRILDDVHADTQIIDRGDMRRKTNRLKTSA